MSRGRTGKPAPNAKYNNPEFIGKKFGRLTVLDIQWKMDGKYQRWMWVCKCDCGKVGTYRGEYVHRGHTTSCGCAVYENKTNLKHGESKTRLYIIWARMKERCEIKNVTHSYWERYAGRGIRVCDEWQNYENFAKWALENGYNDNLSIERVDNDGNYCPENCKWIERGKQARNRRTTLHVNYQGKEMSLAEACEIAGMPYKQVFARIKYMDWPVEKALSIPMHETMKWKRSDRFCKRPNFFPNE